MMFTCIKQTIPKEFVNTKEEFYVWSREHACLLRGCAGFFSADFFFFFFSECPFPIRAAMFWHCIHAQWPEMVGN